MTRESVFFLTVIWTIFGCGLVIEFRMKRRGARKAGVADDLRRLEALQRRERAAVASRRERWEQISFVVTGLVAGGGIIAPIVGTVWVWVLEALLANLAMYWFVFVVQLQIRAITLCPKRVDALTHPETRTSLYVV